MTEKQKECGKPGRSGEYRITGKDDETVRGGGITAAGGSRGAFAAEFSVCPVPCSARPVVYDDSVCIGCGRCAEVCQVDVLVPSLEKGKHPLVMFPGECYYCGSCVMECPAPGAIRLVHPLMNQAKFVPVRRGE